MEQLVLIDGNSLINRAFYAMSILTNKDGICTNAVYGFCNMLIKIIVDVKPKFIAVCFDVKAPTFRHEMYSAYKAGRKPMPNELVMQMPILKETLKKLNITILEQAGIEADDILGTLSKKYPNTQKIILTSDRDALQLVDESVEVWLTIKGLSEIMKITPQNIKEHFGVNADQIIDLKSLMGDSSDNIPGARGIGEVTAKKLIAEYENMKNVYAHIDEISDKIKSKLIESKDNVELSYKLATINTNCDLPCELEEMQYVFPFSQTAFEHFIYLQFYSITKKNELFGDSVQSQDLLSEKHIIDSPKQLDIFFDLIKDKQISLHIDNNINVAINEREQYTIKLMDSLIDVGFEPDVTLAKLFSSISNDQNVIVFDYKDMRKKYEKFNCNFNGHFDDIALLSYVMGYSAISNISTLLQKFAYNDENIACAMFAIYNSLKQKLIQSDAEKIYAAELYVCEILYDMEKCGIKVDIEVLQRLDTQLSAKIDELTNQIYELAGEQFNINSPMQLGNILFEKLGLQSEKMTKRGYGTSNEILENLLDKHVIVEKIIEYRQAAKLKSTYIDGMRNVLTSDSKAHTEFKQFLTYTGRLSSTEPNLQNIPKATPMGKEMRKMFVASNSSNMLISADYSQIELRLLAHLSQDENLINAFNSGHDIHTNTAMHIFNVPKELVTSSMRRQAKAINFGIIYGKGEFSLSKELGITRKDAKKFIDEYFEAYPKVKEYLTNIIANAKNTGFVTTMFGRVRKIPDIKSSNYAARSHAERAATNMPLQGSAADIIKLAMCDVQSAITQSGLSSKLILQVHDELIVDTVMDEIEIIKEILKKQMEHVVKLAVPLDVNVSASYDWFEV